MLRLASTASMPVFPPSLPAGDGCGAELVDQLGPLSGSHVLVLGGQCAELMGGLIRRGCLAAMLLRQAEKPETAAYDLVVAPHVAGDECLDALVRQARRALVPTGEFVARVEEAAAEFRARRLARRLRLDGFTAVRTAGLADAVLVRASLPAFGLAIRA